jgi:spore coat polysaccharide biosynthesis protein SpsF
MNKMNLKKKSTVIIQARTGSNRLPNKVLSKIGTKTMVEQVIQRVKKIKNIEQVILVTTLKNTDKILLEIAKKNEILSFAGSANNVLKRYYDCSKKFNCDPIIRITADCPLLDPLIATKMLKLYQEKKYDYVSNVLPPTFPDGLDVEIFSFKALEKCMINAKLNSEKEHVTAYIHNNKKKFKISNFSNKLNLSNYRWTVDHSNDLKFVQNIYELLKPKEIFSMQNILKIISQNPNLVKYNSKIDRNEGYDISLKYDKH